MKVILIFMGLFNSFLLIFKKKIKHTPMLNLNNNNTFWLGTDPSKVLFKNLKNPAEGCLAETVACRRLGCKGRQGKSQNWRIQNSKNKDSNFSNENRNKIENIVGTSSRVDQTLRSNFNLDKSADKPSGQKPQQQVNFKKVDQGYKNSFSKKDTGINNSKSFLSNNKFSLGSPPIDSWSRSIKERRGVEKPLNRKLRVRTDFSRAVEKIGLIPRSIIRTSDRFRKQLFPGTETLLLQEFRISRYQIIVSLKSLLALIFIPLTVNFLTKNLILTPLIEYCWNNNENDIFLNSTQQEQALNELQDFENEIYFELLVAPKTGTGSNPTNNEIGRDTNNFFNSSFGQNQKEFKNDALPRGGEELKKTYNSEESTRGPSDPGFNQGSEGLTKQNGNFQPALLRGPLMGQQLKDLQEGTAGPQPGAEIQASLYLDQNKLLNQKQQFQEKTVALAIKYNQQSIDSLIRLTSDFITVLTLIGVIIVMKAEIIILKSFLIETVYSFNDTTKSFLIIFITDLLVGFHSSPGWELFFQSILNRFGLPFTETSILLTVAIVPVFLDTLFKYWIFRYLNKISPTTVATLNAMRE